MKKKYLLSFFIIFFLLSANFVLAVEVKYPHIIGFPDLNSTSPPPSLAQYVLYFFKFGIAIAGVLAVISFAIGAVLLIVSADKPESAGNAKDRMKGAILGLILTVASFLIINTINPQIETLSLEQLPPLAGIFYVNNNNERKPCPQENSDTSDILSQGFSNVQYCCNSDCSGGSGTNLLVWIFNNAGLESNNDLYKDVSVKEVKCNDKVDISSTGSFKIAYEDPGIYYYLGDGCSQYASNANTSSEDNIEDTFNGKIKSIKIVNDSNNKIYYGAIFHKEVGLGNAGKCSGPLPQGSLSPGNQCVSVSDIEDTSSADIFQINTTPQSSGNGITLYSAPYGWDKGARAGYWEQSGQDIADLILSGETGEVKPFIYTNVDRPSQYMGICPDFGYCPGSVKIKGSYLVGLYSSIKEDGSGDCQTFTKDVPNMNVQPIVAANSNYIKSVYIIPTK